jgi:centromere protein C
VIAYRGNSIRRRLPIDPGRSKSEAVGAFAGSGFNTTTSINEKFVGYLSGSLTLPPIGVKDPESVGQCTQIFTVIRGQPGSLEVAYGDPGEEEGVLRPATAQRFLLSPEDSFRVPPGNCYRLENHSTTTESLLTWVIIKPIINPVKENEEGMDW